MALKKCQSLLAFESSNYNSFSFLLIPSISADRWFGLWRLVYELSEEFFSVDLPEDFLSTAENWKGIDKYCASAKIPLPKSNSTQGKQMRTIAVAAVVSQTLVKHVFCPMEPDKDLVKGMESLASQDPAREAAYRSMLLSILDHVPKIPADDGAKTAFVGEITERVGPQLSKSLDDKFRERLDTLYHQARKEWRTIQGAKERYEALDEVAEDCWVERVRLSEPSAKNTPTTNGHKPSPEPGSGKKKTKQPSLENISSGTNDPLSLVAPVWPLLKALGSKEEIPALGLFNDQVEAAREEVKRTARQASRSGGKKEEEGRRRSILRVAMA